MSATPPPEVIVAQLKARIHYTLPPLLHRAGMLAIFLTMLSSYWHIPSLGVRLLPAAWRGDILFLLTLPGFWGWEQ